MQIPRRQPAGEAGFSLVEVLVAALILLVIALGMVPLFTRSITSNVEGFENTEVSNFARSRAEEFLQYPFNSPRLTVPVGQDTLTVKDYYSNRDDKWVDTLPSGDVELFTRTTEIRQFGINDLDNPLSGGADPTAIHLKEITVTVEGRGIADAFGTGKKITVRTLKSQ